MPCIWPAKGAWRPLTPAWDMQCQALEHLAVIWKEPDDGIWEVRGPRQHFTHSKVMAWVAFDRSIKDAEKYSLDAPLERWRKIRDADPPNRAGAGFPPCPAAFTQSFGSRGTGCQSAADAAGRLPAHRDPRVTGTIAAIERELMVDGLVMRYRSESGADGLPAGRRRLYSLQLLAGRCLPAAGPRRGAEALLERLLALRNDVGPVERGIRHARATSGRQFPAGVLASCAGAERARRARGMPLRDQLTAKA